MNEKVSIKKLDSMIQTADDILFKKIPAGGHSVNNGRSFCSPEYFEIDGIRFKRLETSIKQNVLGWFGKDSEYFKQLETVNRFNNNNCSNLERYLSVLRSIRDNYSEKEPNMQNDKVDILQNIFDNFGDCARQLLDRHAKRGTLKIKDEYDVQDLLHAILKLFFNDVRAEEHTPSYTGGSSRIDFFLDDEKIAIETKMTRANLKDKEIGKELTEDIARYAQLKSVERLYCFIYDPDRLIRNRNGLKKDLEKDKNMQTRVFFGN